MTNWQQSKSWIETVAQYFSQRKETFGFWVRSRENVVVWQSFVKCGPDHCHSNYCWIESQFGTRPLFIAFPGFCHRKKDQLKNVVNHRHFCWIINFFQNPESIFFIQFPVELYFLSASTLLTYFSRMMEKQTPDFAKNWFHFKSIFLLKNRAKFQTFYQLFLFGSWHFCFVLSHFGFLESGKKGWKTFIRISYFAIEIFGI